MPILPRDNMRRFFGEKKAVQPSVATKPQRPTKEELAAADAQCLSTHVHKKLTEATENRSKFASICVGSRDRNGMSLQERMHTVLQILNGSSGISCVQPFVEYNAVGYNGDTQGLSTTYLLVTLQH